MRRGWVRSSLYRWAETRNCFYQELHRTKQWNLVEFASIQTANRGQQGQSVPFLLSTPMRGRRLLTGDRDTALQCQLFFRSFSRTQHVRERLIHGKQTMLVGGDAYLATREFTRLKPVPSVLFCGRTIRCVRYVHLKHPSRKFVERICCLTARLTGRIEGPGF